MAGAPAPVTAACSMTRIAWLFALLVGLLGCDAFVQDVLPLLAGLRAQPGPRDFAATPLNDTASTSLAYGASWAEPGALAAAHGSRAEMTRRHPSWREDASSAPLPAARDANSSVPTAHDSVSHAASNTSAAAAAALLRSVWQRDVNAAAAADSAIAAFSLLITDASSEAMHRSTVATYAGTLLMDAGLLTSAQAVFHAHRPSEWTALHFLRAAELAQRMGEAHETAWPLLDLLVRHQLRVPSSAFPPRAGVNTTQRAGHTGAGMAVCSSSGASLLTCPTLKPSAVSNESQAKMQALFLHQKVDLHALQQLPATACAVDALLALADTTRAMGRYRDTERLLNTAADAIVIIMNGSTHDVMSATGKEVIADDMVDAVRFSCAAWNSSHARLAALRVTHAYRCLAHTRVHGASSARAECLFEELTPALSASLRRHALPRTLDMNSSVHEMSSAYDDVWSGMNSTEAAWPQRFAELMLSVLVTQSITNMHAQAEHSGVASMHMTYSHLRALLAESFGTQSVESAAGAIAHASALMHHDDPVQCEDALTLLAGARRTLVDVLGPNEAQRTLPYARSMVLTARARVCAEAHPSAATHNASLAYINATRDVLTAVYNASHPAIAELDSVAALTAYARERGYWTCTRVQLPHASAPAILANATIPFLSCQERDAMRASKVVSESFEMALESWARLPKDAVTRMRAAFAHVYMTWDVRYNSTRFMTLTQAAAQHALLAADVASPHVRMLLPTHALAGAGVNASALSNAYAQTDFSPLSNVLNAEHAQVVLVLSSGGVAAAMGRAPPPRLSPQEQKQVASLSSYSVTLSQLRKLSAAAHVVTKELAGASHKTVCTRVVLQDAVTVFRQITRALAGVALTLLDSTGNGGADLSHPAAIFTHRLPGMTDEDLVSRQRVWRVLAEAAAVADKMYERAQAAATTLAQAAANASQAYSSAHPTHGACQRTVDAREALHPLTYVRADVMRAYAMGGVVDLLHSVTHIRDQALDSLTHRVSERVRAATLEPEGDAGVWRDAMRTGDVVLLTRAHIALREAHKRAAALRAHIARGDEEDVE